MSKEEIMALEGRELDAAVALAIGWKWVPFPKLRRSRPSEAYLQPPEQAKKYIPGHVLDELPKGWRGNYINIMPKFSEDLNACRRAEEAMITGGNDMLYLTRLETLTTAGKKRTAGDVLGMARADAMTRCRAMLLAAIDE